MAMAGGHGMAWHTVGRYWGRMEELRPLFETQVRLSAGVSSEEPNLATAGGKVRLSIAPLAVEPWKPWKPWNDPQTLATAGGKG